MARYYFLDDSKLNGFIKALTHYGELWGFDEQGELKKFELKNGSLPLFHKYRQTDSFKPVLFNALKVVAEYPGGRNKFSEPTPKVLVDLKPCDIAAIRVFDSVFIEDKEFVDPFVKSARENLFIVAGDCSEALPTCFCNLVGGKPYPEDGYDILLSKIDGGFIVDIATEKGKGLLEGFALPQATPDKEKELERKRAKVTAELEEQNANLKTKNDYYHIVKERYNSLVWGKEASRCVSCGACTNVCPTCYCFGLADHKTKDKFIRTMNWDSCQFSGFSRMAGMLNPRPLHRQHFEHRYDHKFHHFKERYDFYACTGCGRCIENCLGKIDMRQVLKGADEQKGS